MIRQKRGSISIFTLLAFAIFVFAGLGYLAYNKSGSKTPNTATPIAPSTNVNSKCNLLPETGPCKAKFTKYYFDKSTNRCSSFVWGGCQGAVPFETLEDCQNTCESDTDSSYNLRVSWDEAVTKIKNCEIKLTMQSHDLEVGLVGKDGTKYTTTEPNIDEVSKVANSVRDTCPVGGATE